LALVALASASSKIRFEGYKVLRITPNTPEQAEFLAGLEEKGVVFWDGPAPVGRHNDMMFPPHLQGDLLDHINKSGMKVEPFVENVQEIIDLQDSAPKSPKLDWNNYVSAAEIYAWMEERAAAHPGLATVGELGQSYEKRSIKYMEINKGNTEKPTIWVDANIHAREWITNTIATYLINQILDGEYQHWADNFNWIIAPMLNPDGYEFSRASNRMWRKTRSPNSGSSCLGTDANRNFGFHWMEGGASSNPCSDTYGGSSAFSEVETQAVRDFIELRQWAGTEFVFYLSLHSYSQLILISYGLESSPGRPYYGPNFDEHLALGQAAAAAHADRFGTVFRPGNIVDLLYVASGGSMDWALGDNGIPWGATYEMRDTGRYGFILPPDQIQPSCEEFMDGFEVYMVHLASLYTKK